MRLTVFDKVFSLSMPSGLLVKPDRPDLSVSGDSERRFAIGLSHVVV